MYSVQCYTIVQCTVYSVHCTVYSVQCYTIVQCTVYTNITLHLDLKTTVLITLLQHQINTDCLNGSLCIYIYSVQCTVYVQCIAITPKIVFIIFLTVVVNIKNISSLKKNDPNELDHLGVIWSKQTNHI